MKNCKQMLLVLVPIALVSIILIGCGSGKNNKDEDAVKSELYNKYGEEFDVIGIQYGGYGGGRYKAVCYPVNDSRIVFTVEMIDDKMISPDSDTYLESKSAVNMNDIFKSDLGEYFPGALYYTHKSNLGFFLYIYYDESIGTAKKYDEEFYYFRDKVDEYVNEGIMPGDVSVTIMKVKSEELVKLEEFFKTNTHEYLYKGSAFKDIFGIEHYEQYDVDGIYCRNNPPEISACFKKAAPAYIGEDLDEYIRRREYLEKTPR